MSKATLLIFLFIGLLSEFTVGSTFGEHGVIGSCDLMRGGLYCLDAAAAGFGAAIERPESGLAAAQSGGGNAECLGGPISFAFDFFCLGLCRRRCSYRGID